MVDFRGNPGASIQTVIKWNAVLAKLLSIWCVYIIQGFRILDIINNVFVSWMKAEVSAYPPFPGVEKNYLRAQIARISATTVLAPKDYFVVSYWIFPVIWHAYKFLHLYGWLDNVSLFLMWNYIFVFCKLVCKWVCI